MLDAANVQVNRGPPATNVSIVSVSRLAGPPHLGHSVFTQSVAAASG